MCGHGTIGLVRTFEILRDLNPEHIESIPRSALSVPRFTRMDEFRSKRLASYRAEKDFGLAVDGLGKVVGDIAWGGNWFFRIENHGLDVAWGNREALMDYCVRVKRARAPARSTTRRRKPEGSTISNCLGLLRSLTAGVLCSARRCL